MSEELQQKLRTQLWTVANALRGNMSASDFMYYNDDRFSKAGRLAPRKTADYAFILHMIYHLNEGGTMACVAPHGVLFRGNAKLDKEIEVYLKELGIA